MTYEFLLSKTLERKLKKFQKKNKKLFLACRKKIIEIIENPTSYKHLRHDVRYRVHVGGSFVLSYRINEKEKHASSQLTSYATAISYRTKTPLENIICAYFDESRYYEFSLADL